VTSDRERLGRYLADAPDPPTPATAAALFDVSPLASLSPARRTALERRALTALARAYVNLGVMQAQKQRFARAADFFAKAVAADAQFPQAQYSLAVASFNSQQYEKAVAPLIRALEEKPDDLDLRRMLALAYVNTDAYAEAAALLRDDPRRRTDAPLEYAYALALIHSNRPDEAEGIFARLLAERGSLTPELAVLRGQAQAQQGDYDAAIASFEEALRLDAHVADANAALGVIYLKSGRLAEAERALRAELAAHADHMPARQTLAAVLDAETQPEEALQLLRTVLARRPGFADAHYLSGKILLALGRAQEAADELETARRIAPDDANIHYQLGQAYQKLGRVDAAQQAFETFRQLKDKRRGSAR
jgi:tetratricopeptide (TPR) repeat protein